MSDDRQRPDYGEYATPEEQRAMQMPLDPRAANDPNAPLAQLAFEGRTDKTPTLGRDSSLIQDLFGNIGSVSSGGGPAGTSGGTGRDGPK